MYRIVHRLNYGAWLWAFGSNLRFVVVDAVSMSMPVVVWLSHDAGVGGREVEDSVRRVSIKRLLSMERPSPGNRYFSIKTAVVTAYPYPSAKLVGLNQTWLAPGQNAIFKSDK